MADPAHERTDEMIEEIRQRVSREYLIAYEGAEAKLSDYLSRFEAKDRIHAEAVRRGEETEADYREWRRGQVLMGERWQEMVDTLAEDYRNADRIAASIVNGYLPDAYALNHDYATFQVEQGSKVDTSYTLYDRATVERLVRDQPGLLPKADIDEAKDLRWNRQHISSAITQGVLQGESMDEVAKRLRSVADMDFRASMRTARTAMTSAQNAGRTDAYRRAQGMGIQVRKQWLATLDQRTRHSHRALDGEVVGLDERFSNGLEYPGDPSGAGSEVYNCRCTLVPDLPGVDAEEGERASRLGGVSYEEWRAGHERPRPVEAVPAPEGALLPHVAQALGQDYVDAMDTLLSFTEEQDAASLYRRYGDAVRIGDPGIEGGAYFDNTDGRVYMNSDLARSGDGDLHRPYQTAFHEFAHAIDFMGIGDGAGRTAGAASVKWRGSDGRGLRQVLADDWVDYKRSWVRRALDEADEDAYEDLVGMSPRLTVREVMSVEYDRRWRDASARLRGMGQSEIIRDPEFVEYVRDVYLAGDESYKVDSRSVVFYLKREHPDVGEGATVSDALEGITDIDYPLGSGHGRDYHHKDGNTELEFFAEVLDSKVCNPAALEFAREVFPDGVRAVEQILREAMER